MAYRPPRVTSRRNQRTTRAPARPPAWWTGPSVISGYNPATGFRPAPTAPMAPGGGPAANPMGQPSGLSDLPPDPSYDAQIAGLQRQRDDTLAALTQSRASGLLDYGFTEGPNGALAFDPNNPFSRAALLKQSYDRSRASARTSMAAQGQLYSGAFQNAQDLVNRNQLQGEDQMQKALGAFLVRNTQQRAQTGTGYETTAGQAMADRVGRFQTNPLYQPATADSTPTTAAAIGPTKQTAAIGRPTKTVNGRRFYQRASDGKWIPF